MIVLGLETSCDETGLALYDSEVGLRAQVLYSQIKLHAEYGGVVPELASRDHVRKLIPLMNQLLEESKIQKGLSIIIVFSSALMLSNLTTLKQKKHPDIDQRLLTMINKLNFIKKENEFYIWYLGCYILNMYLNKLKINYFPSLCDTHQELFFKYLNQLDKIKEVI